MKVSGIFFNKAVTAASGVVFFVAWLVYHQACNINSDAAISSIIGQDIASGNILLKNWFLSTQPYYTTDYLLHGLLYYITNDLYYTSYLGVACILFFVFVSVSHIVKHCVRHDYIAYTLLIYIIFVIAMRSTIYASPVHYAPIAFCILSVYFYYQQDSKTSGLFFVLSSFMAIAGDMYAVFYMAIPLCIEAALHCWRIKRLEQRLLLFLPAAVLVFAFGWFLQKYGYSVPGFKAQFADIAALPGNLDLCLKGWFALFSAYFWMADITFAKRLVRLAFSILPLSCLAVHIYYARSPLRVARFLCLSSFIITAAFICSNAPVDMYSGRYLLGVAVNSIILIAVFMVNTFPGENCRALARAGALLLGGIFLLLSLVLPPSQDKVDTAALAEALRERKLQTGYAEFWSAYSTEFAADGEVRVAAIAAAGESFAPYYWLSKTDWYDRPAYFVIRDEAHPASRAMMLEDRLLKTFGAFSDRFMVNGRYTIYVWQEDLGHKLVGKR